jgi:hypothetical protein
VSATRVPTVRDDVPSDRRQAKSGLSVSTLMIASASSLAAALVVSKIWGGGTLIGAAMTPVIVTLVSEALRRPATVITSVRPPIRGARFDPVAEGRAGLREGDLETARAAMPAAAAAERRVHRVSGGVVSPGGLRRRVPRARLIAAVVMGLVAFVVAGAVLTGSELVLGKSVVSASKRTTYIPVHRSTAATKAKTTTTSTTGTTPRTTTTTTPGTSAPTATAPPTTSTPAAAPPAQTAPAPTTSTPAPAAPPGTPATPAPQSPAPPASTTP